MTRSSTRLGAVKAMVWKEVRERFLWTMVVLVAAVAILTLMCVSTYDDANSWHSTNDGFRGLWDSAQATVAIAVPLFALCLGFAQMNGEGSRDAWAFLVHRPTTRATMFWGKALAGIALCALVVTVVYGGFVLWMAFFVRAPIPFSWWLLGFALVAMALSVSFYFVGALLALRQRSWFGSRSLPLLAVANFYLMLLGLSIFVYQTVVLYVVVGAAIVVLALAAQGCFENQTLARRNRWVQIALGVVLLAGLYAVVSPIRTLSFMLFSPLTEDPSPSETVEYNMTTEGRILLRHISDDNTMSFNKRQTLSEPNGKLVAQGTQVGKIKFVEFAEMVPFRGPGQPLPFTYGDIFVFTGQSADKGIGNVPNVAWWFDRAHRRLIGIETERRRIFGYIGTNGFVREAEKCQPFFEQPLPDQANSDRLVFPHSLYSLDLWDKSVVKLYDSPEEIKSVISGVISTSTSPPSESELTVAKRSTNIQPAPEAQIIIRQNDVVFLTTDAITKTQRAPYRNPEVHTVLLPDPSRNKLEYARHFDGRFWLRFTPHAPGPVTIFALSPRGEVLKKTVLPPLPIVKDSASWNARTAMNIAISIMPASFLKTSAYLVQNPSSDGVEMPDARFAYEMLLLSFVFSAAAALATWRRANRYAFKSSTRLWWTIGVFALGPLGLLLMRSLLDWSALEKCPSCGKLRVVDRELCEHCNSPFAPPLIDGTEIIENEAPEMPALRLAS